MVDGKASEAIWKKSEGLGVLKDEGDDAFVNFEGQNPGQFIQYYPYDTSLAETQTRFALAYDEKFLYAFLFAKIATTKNLM